MPRALGSVTKPRIIILLVLCLHQVIKIISSSPPPLSRIKVLSPSGPIECRVPT